MNTATGTEIPATEIQADTIISYPDAAGKQLTLYVGHVYVVSGKGVDVSGRLVRKDGTVNPARVRSVRLPLDQVVTIR